jgi:hypothetical protein
MLNLRQMLDEAAEPVHCPRCGIYQPAVVLALQKKIGGHCEPNIRISCHSSWRSGVRTSGGIRGICVYELDQGSRGNKQGYGKFNKGRKSDC